MKSIFAILLMALLFSPIASRADYGPHRLSLGAGVAEVRGSSDVYFSISGEYEYRIDPYFGGGLSADHVFSSPAITLLAIPQVYFHPLQNNFYVSASPLVAFVSGQDTQVGARFGTRIPLNFGVFEIIPQASIDFISGGRNLIFGIGIGI